MEKYEILHQIGEGSFGQVYKAKRRATGEIVAYKIVKKGGRSTDELVSLRRECEIQRYLCHPNIIRMLDSFETDSELVVVSEYADKALHELLAKTGKLSEERAQVITCDLVSALYYLHSNKVLHRDLKPQNVLLDANGIAKLCDFGFACSMGNRTHVLASFKGTPLYMAPELIEEYPYDHNVDLWSLGCIVYEMVTGIPPFATSSMVQLINCIRHESIKWPNFVSSNCTTFLQGLLQKDPLQRLTWPSLLSHSFVKNRILIIEENVPVLMKNLPSPSHFSVNNHITYSNSSQEKKNNKTEPQFHLKDKQKTYSNQTCYSIMQVNTKDETNNSNSISESPPYANVNVSHNKKDCKSQSNNTPVYANIFDENKQEKNIYENAGVLDWESSINNQPIENEEWIAFLQHSMEEIMEGEIESLLQEKCVIIFTSPLKNSGANCRVIEYISYLLSLPFVLPLKKDDIENIQKIYINTTIVSSLICAIQNIIINSENKQLNLSRTLKKSDSDAMFTTEKLQALEAIVVLLCRLIYMKEDFIKQFCNALHATNKIKIFHSLFYLEKRKSRVVADLIAILIRVMHTGNENARVIEKILLQYKHKDLIDLFTNLMCHQQSALRSRTCILIYLLAKFNCHILRQIWGRSIRNALEALNTDDDTSVKRTAEEIIPELKQLVFYNQEIEAG